MTPETFRTKPTRSSTATPCRADNPELRRAAERGIPASSYFEMLGRLGVGRRTVAIAGTHGKSTVTAMAAHLLVAAGRDPTVVCGATPLGSDLRRTRRHGERL